MAALINTKSLQVTLTTGNETGDQTILINRDVGPLELEVNFQCRMDVRPKNNRAFLAITNLSEPKRIAIAGIVSEKLEYDDVEVLEFTGSDGGTERRLVGTKELIPEGFTKQETIRVGDCFVEVDAGVNKRVGRIFEGSSKRADHQESDGTWTTTLDIGDSVTTMIKAVARSEFDPGVELYDVVNFIIKTMSLDPGNFSRQQLNSAVGANISRFPDGFTVAGDSAHLLNEMLINSGVEWWVDRGKFYIVNQGDPLEGKTLEASADLGLRAKPRPLPDGGTAIYSDFRGDFRLGRILKLKSDVLAGEYRLDRIEHNLNNREGDWSTFAILRQFIIPGIL